MYFLNDNLFFFLLLLFVKTNKNTIKTNRLSELSYKTLVNTFIDDHSRSYKLIKLFSRLYTVVHTQLPITLDIVKIERANPYMFLEFQKKTYKKPLFSVLKDRARYFYFIW